MGLVKFQAAQKEVLRTGDEEEIARLLLRSVITAKVSSGGESSVWHTAKHLKNNRRKGQELLYVDTILCIAYVKNYRVGFSIAGYTLINYRKGLLPSKSESHLFFVQEPQPLVYSRCEENTKGVMAVVQEWHKRQCDVFADCFASKP